MHPGGDALLHALLEGGAEGAVAVVAALVCGRNALVRLVFRSDVMGVVDMNLYDTRQDYHEDWEKGCWKVGVS